MRSVWERRVDPHANVAFAQSKIGYVDLQRALNESEAGKKAKDEFKVQVDKLQAPLKKQKDEIDSMKDQLDKKALVMKDEERASLEDDYRKKLRDFERNYKDSQADLQKKDNELTGVHHQGPAGDHSRLRRARRLHAHPRGHQQRRPLRRQERRPHGRHHASSTTACTLRRRRGNDDVRSPSPGKGGPGPAGNHHELP